MRRRTQIGWKSAANLGFHFALQATSYPICIALNPG